MATTLIKGFGLVLLHFIVALVACLLWAKFGGHVYEQPRGILDTGYAVIIGAVMGALIWNIYKLRR